MNKIKIDKEGPVLSYLMNEAKKLKYKLKVYDIKGKCERDFELKETMLKHFGKIPIAFTIKEKKQIHLQFGFKAKKNISILAHELMHIKLNIFFDKYNDRNKEQVKKEIKIEREAKRWIREIESKIIYDKKVNE